MKRPPTPRRPLRRWLCAAGTALCLGAAALTATAPAQATPAPAAPQARPATADGPPYPVGDLGTAVHNFIASPDTVAGANNWTCKPTARHPRPVVLTHGTFANSGANWVALAPMLANEGYCVYTLNYGMNQLSLGRVGGLTDIGASATSLGTFVDKVLAATGAEKVDLVGHSQGGMMPNQYLKRLGGARKVHALVGIAPSNHGTTLDGLVDLGNSMNALGFANSFLDLAGLTALKQQEAGSDFQNALWKDGDTVPGVRYTVIQTRHDKVVTPYTNAFLHGEGVTNVLLQDQCPDDKVGHVGLFLDGPTLQNVMNALGPADPGFKPSCTNYGPAT
ncbi:esterase/lipase family protein [Streptomyces sp. NPDC050161]|uniref:esterase/lipase family protein n=1 Tax=Streptomyces sp. NPDC050161 TaxID=3365604 RepID=UPI00378FA272